MSASSQRTSLPTAMPGAAQTPASVFGSSGWPGARATVCGAGDFARAGVLFDFAVRRAQQFLGDRFDRLLRPARRCRATRSSRLRPRRVRAIRRRFRSAPCGLRNALRPSHRNRAPLHGHAPPAAHAGRPRERASRCGGLRRSRWRRCGRRRPSRRPWRAAPAAAFRPLSARRARARSTISNASRVGNRDHRDEARRMSRDLIRVELDQHLAGAHVLRPARPSAQSPCRSARPCRYRYAAESRRPRRCASVTA